MQIGRFDIHSSSFFCSSCGECKEGGMDQYVISGFCPGYPAEDCTYFFHTDVLSFWQKLKNSSPGTSLLKFVDTLKTISKLHGRVCICIFRQLYSFLMFYVYCRMVLSTITCSICRAVILSITCGKMKNVY